MKQRIFKLCYVGVMLLVSSLVVAETHSIYSRDDLVHYALDHNPALVSQRLIWESSLDTSKILSHLPDPKVGWRWNGLPSNNDAYYGDQQRYVVEQSFPYFGVIDHLEDDAEVKSQVVYFSYMMKKNEIIFSVDSLLYNLILNQVLLAILKKNESNLESLINITEINYQSGINFQSALLKLKIAKVRYEEDALRLEHQRLQLMEELKQIVGISSDISLADKIIYPDFQILGTPNETWLSQSLLIQKAETLGDVSDFNVILQTDKGRPSFSAQIEFWNHSGMDNQGASQVMMTVPWLSTKYKEIIDQSKKDAKAEQFKVQDTKTRVMKEFNVMVSELVTISKIITLYESTILEHAHLSLSNFQKAFEGNKASVIDYFEAEQDVFDVEKKLAMLKNKYFIGLSQLKSQFEKGVIPHD